MDDISSDCRVINKLLQTLSSGWPPQRRAFFSCQLGTHRT